MKTLDLGNVTIDKIIEIDLLWVDPYWFFKNIDEATMDRQAEWMGPRHFNASQRMLGISFHSYLIKANGLNILIDTCNGNHKERKTPSMHWQNQLKLTRYMEDLAKHDLTPDDIDVVMCTHLHTDHVGWNTQLIDGRWVPTFKNARYIFSKKDFEHLASMHAKKPENPVGHGSFEDSVLPIVEAGLAELVDNDFGLFHGLEENVCLEPSPGHTPGHVFVNVQGSTGQALITGDAIHHPIQLRERQLISVGDFDHDLANKTRYDMLDRCCETGTLMMTAHFTAPSAGHVRRDGDLYEFDFLE